MFQELTPLPVDHPAVARLSKAMRSYVEPSVQAALPAGVARNVVGFHHTFNREFPGLANVWMFRTSSSPNDKTAAEEMHQEYGAVLRILLGRGAPALHIPKQQIHDNVGVVAFPLGRNEYGETVQQSVPIVFTFEHRGLKALLPIIKAAVTGAIAARNIPDYASVEVFDEHAESVIAGLRALVHQQNTDYQILLNRLNTIRNTMLQVLGVDNAQ